MMFCIPTLTNFKSMTNIEIVNAINSAIADGRKVKAKVKTDDVMGKHFCNGDIPITGAFLATGAFGDQYILVTWNTEPHPETVQVVALSKNSQIRSFIQHEPTESDVEVIREFTCRNDDVNETKT